MKVKRILVCLMTLTMIIGCFGSTTAFAAEEELYQTLEFQLDADEGYIAVPASIINQTFSMTTTHRGADRTYSASTLRFSVTITDSNGNACNSVVAVELHDYNQSTPISTAIIGADGGTYGHTVPITPGRVYYFYYRKTAGDSRTLSVNMIING